MRREELYSASESSSDTDFIKTDCASVSSSEEDFDLDFVNKGVDFNVKNGLELFKFRSATRAAPSWLWQSLTKACEREGKPALLEDKKVLIAGCVLGVPE